MSDVDLMSRVAMRSVARILGVSGLRRLKSGGVLIAAVLLLPSGSVSARVDVIDRVLAIVDGHVITLSDVRAAHALGLIAPPAGADPEAFVLERLIDRVLVLQEVDRYAPPEPDAEAMDRGVAAIVARRGESSVDVLLRRFGLEPTFVREWVRNDLRIAQYLDQRFAGVTEPSDEEIENYRRQHGTERAAGAPVDEARVRETARAGVMHERREALVREWIEGLRGRAEISRSPVTAQ